MEREKLFQIMESLKTKAAICNIEREAKTYDKNFRECPVWSELVGMMETMKILGVEIEFDFDFTNYTKITAIKAEGITITV